MIVLENCKPILGEKIRYHREKVFMRRLMLPPAVPAMDMDLHFARVQQRLAWAPDEIDLDQGLRLEQLAVDPAGLPDFAAAASPVDVAAAIDQFFDATRLSAPASGGTVEPAADEDGVMVDEPAAEPDDVPRSPEEEVMP